jgi:hypothetical protein
MRDSAGQLFILTVASSLTGMCSAVTPPPMPQSGRPTPNEVDPDQGCGEALAADCEE